ncbi:MAG: hypothetical protein HY328_14855 [Chloroflexi bacterium]|nr:hypothetical protein [Chloroflexota bacterium]
MLFLIAALFLWNRGEEEVAPTADSLSTPVVTLAAATEAAAATDTPAPLPTSTPASAEENDESYPAPAAVETTAQTAGPESYPAPGEVTAALTGYPAPVEPTPETSRIPIVPFVLERPLESGATVVRGSGPANVPIVIANVFLMGEVIGDGVIGADGRFEVTVAPPLEKGHWIGIALDELSGTDFAYEDFYAQGFRGEGAEQVPQVGFIYDSDYVR